MWKFLILIFCSIQLINADYKCNVFDSTFCFVQNQAISATESFVIVKNMSIETTGIILADGHMPVLPNAIFTTYPNITLFSTANTGLTKLLANNFVNGRKLTNLLIMNGQVESLANATFKNCRNLLSLQITNQKISFIDASAFQGLINLENLNLKSNEMTYLNPLILGPLVNLHLFNIGKNQLTSLDSNLFVKNLKVIAVYFDNNELTEIPNDLFAAQNLSSGTIDFSYNKLTTAQSFGAKYVDMTFNRLKIFQFASGGKKPAIRIENNIIGRVTCLSADLTVERLYVANNNLQNLLCIRDMTNLTTLDISSNRILKPTQKTFAKFSNMIMLMMYNMTKFSSIPVKAFLPLKDKLINLRVDKLDSFKTVKQLLPNLGVLGLNTVKWNCSYVKFVRELLKTQQIAMIFTAPKDAHRCDVE